MQKIVNMIANARILCSIENTMDNNDFFSDPEELLNDKKKTDDKFEESVRKLQESERKFVEEMMKSPEGRKALEEMHKEQDREQERADQAQMKIINRVRSAIEGECMVIYDAFSYDDDGVAIDNLDEIAIEGYVRAVDEIRDSYTGEILMNPTWLELTIEANRMILASEDYHHRFFEGIDVLSEDDKGVKDLSLLLGS